MADKVTVRIESSADTKGFDAVDNSVKKTTKNLKDLKDAGKEAGDALEQGLGIGIGDRVLSGLGQIPEFFKNAVEEGIKFNSTVEGARLGIAAVLKQFDSAGKYTNFQDALRASGDAIDMLKEKAKESPATFEQLVQGFQGLSGAFASAGLDMKQQVDLVVLMSQALSGLGIRSDQLLQESRALVTGNITEDAAAARILGITKQQVDDARESGQLFEFLTGKLSAFAEAGAEGAKSYATQLSNLEDSLQQLKGVATEELFEQIKGGLAGVNDELSTEKATQWAAGIGKAIGGLVEDIASISSSLDNSKLFKILTFSPLRDAATRSFREDFNSGARARQVNDLDAEQIALRKGMNVEGDIEQTEAVSKLTETIAKRREEASKATGDEAVLLNRQADILQKMLDHRERIFAMVKGEAPAQEKVVEQTEKQVKETAQLAEQVDQLLGRIRKSEVDMMSGPQQINTKGDEIAAMRAAFEKRYAVTTPDWNPAEMAEQVAGSSADPKAKKELLSDLLKIIEATRELNRLNEEGGKELDKQMETEAKRWQAKEDLMRALQDELAIQVQVTAGHDTAAKLLEIERDLHKQIADIQKSEMAPAEKQRAIDLATQTSELQKQKALNDQIAAQDKARDKASDYVNDTKPGFDTKLRGSAGAHARAADKDKYLRNYDKEVDKDLKDSGVDDATRAKMREEAAAEYDRKSRQARGRFGGDASVSPANRALGLTPTEDWAAKFGQRGSASSTVATAGNEVLGPSAPAGIATDTGELFGPSALELSPMTNAGGGFGNMPIPEGQALGFGGVPFGELMPEPMNNPSMIAGGPTANPEGGENQGTDSLEQAGQAGQEAAQAISDAADQVKDAMDTLKDNADAFDQVKSSADAVKSTLDSKLGEIKAKLDEITTTIQNQTI